MNDLQKAKFFDYSLHMATGFADYKNAKTIDYKIVWKINGRLATANALRYQGNRPVGLSVSHTWMPSEEILSTKNSLNRFPDKFEEQFNKYFDVENPYSDFAKLYQQELPLFIQLLKFNEKIKKIDTSKFNEFLYNVKFLDTNVELPFIKLSDEDLIIPVSLIEASEN